MKNAKQIAKKVFCTIGVEIIFRISVAQVHGLLDEIISMKGESNFIFHKQGFLFVVKRNKLQVSKMNSGKPEFQLNLRS